MSQAVQRSLPRPVPQAAPDLRPSEVSFYVPAVDLPSRSRHTIKHGDSFLVMDSHGDIGASSGGADGFFHNDTRFVSLLELRLDGEVPLSLGSNVRDDNSALSADLTNPDIYVDGRVVMQKDTVHVVRTTYVHHNTAYQRVAVKNYSDRTVRFELSFRFASDFADIFEVRGASRPRRGIARAPSIGPDAVLLNYEGLDGVLRQTKVVFDPAPNTLEHHTARYQLTLAPNQVAAIFLALACGPAETWKPNFFKGLLAARRETRAATRNAATVQTSNAIFNEVLCRSMADLYMLMTETPDGRYPYAGIPWYSTTFGRDGLITAQEMLWLNPEIARGVLQAPRALSGDNHRSRSGRRAVARSCTKCAAARWPRCARSRSVSTTAASMQRHCSSCWPASTWNEPARSADAARAVARDRSGAGLDRRPRRSRR